MNRFDTFLEKYALGIFIALVGILFGVVCSAVVLWRSSKLALCTSHSIPSETCSQLLSSIIV